MTIKSWRTWQDICVKSSFATTAATFQGPSSQFINTIVSQDYFAEYHLLDYSSNSGPNYINVTSAVNLLNNQEISSKAERFIRTFYPNYIYLVRGIKRQALSSGDQQVIMEEPSCSIINEHNVKYD